MYGIASLVVGKGPAGRHLLRDGEAALLADVYNVQHRRAQVRQRRDALRAHSGHVSMGALKQSAGFLTHSHSGFNIHDKRLERHPSNEQTQPGWTQRSPHHHPCSNTVHPYISYAA